ncbi:hypothetical protein B0H14DRAFT_3534204 [Mycena olivaceomarginata]|nr:hypothetical protein B0H14DRAFT_3534204 [Mycena olivaceomarginata]
MTVPARHGPSDFPAPSPEQRAPSDALPVALRIAVRVTPGVTYSTPRVKACSQADIQSLENDYNHTHATRQDVQRKLAQEREARLLHSSPERDPFKSWAAGDPDNKRLLAQRQRPLSLSKCKQLSDTSSVAIKPPTRATAESSTTSSMAEMETSSRLSQASEHHLTHLIALLSSIPSCEHYSSRTRNHWVRLQHTGWALQIERAAREKSVGHWAVWSERYQLILLNVTTALSTTARHEDGPLDLPDMTARRFLRHPAIKSYLYTTFPDLRNPTLSHLHPSLANRAHLRVQHLKRLQDEQLPRHLHYIRVMLDIKNDSLPAHEEDEPPLLPEEKSTRIIICMTPHSSSRLQKAQYLQSDIGFKRIVLFFCRVYLTRHTAAAHQRIFEEIDKIVEFDGGRRLRWRHLHGQSLEDFQGLILHWGADQHRGQAKGESHLSFAALPPGQMDLHESWRTLRKPGAIRAPPAHLSTV